MDGLYATMTVADSPTPTTPSQQAAPLGRHKYKHEVQRRPQRVLGLRLRQHGQLFIKRGAYKVGPNLSTDSFVKTMDTMSVPRATCSARPEHDFHALALASSLALAQGQGVSKSEIVVGSIQDFSGPLAGFGKQVRNGHDAARGRVQRARRHEWPQDRAEVRRLRVRPQEGRAGSAEAGEPGQDLHDGGHIGTAQNLAAMPVQFEKNVINFWPVTAAREMYEPFHKLKYSFAATYYDQMRTVMPKLVKEKKRQEGLHHVPGRRVRPGGAARRRSRPEGHEGMTMAEKTSYKRGATDFSSQVAKLKAAGCDWSCWAPSSARPLAPSAKRARPASTRPSWAPARPTPT
jgi:hypothetical protein